MKGQAAILTALEQPLVIGEVEVPSGLGFGQVLVRVKYSGICGSQLGEIDGVKGPDRYLPHLLGHEGSGEVLKIGPGVTCVAVGDHVVMHWRKGLGIEAEPPSYRWRGQAVNAGFVTTFNQYAVVSENRLTAIPQAIDGKIAALMGCAVTTGLGTICNIAELKIGQSIAVMGAGGIGLNMIQGAALTSAHPIIGVDLYENRLRLATKFGATHVINSGEKDVETEVRAIAGEGGVDVCIDNTGAPSVINMAYRITRPQGKTVLVGVPNFKDNISIHSLPLHFGKTLTGSHGGDTQPTFDIPRYLKLFQAGKLKLSELVTDVFDLGEINHAIDRMRDGRLAGRCIIDLS
jgi:S-(hydroxymethyl)glutathione dehydrogenase/alcohol dehydrogenase